MRALLVLAVCAPLAVAQTTTLAHLPNTTVNAVQTDAAGNIYITGYTGVVQTPAGWDAFVAKLSPTGQTIYSTSFAGSKSDSARAIAVDGSGAAYIFGQTASADFPVTVGALQTTMQAPGVQGFAAKVDAGGKVVYATYIGGSNDIYQNLSPSAFYVSGGLVVDSAGDAILSGLSRTYVKTSNPLNSYEATASFVTKLDPLGANVLGSVQGIGGLLALDSEDNVYVAGAYIWNNYTSYETPIPAPAPIPITPGAFQSSHQAAECSGSDASSWYQCPYQYVAKLNPGLNQTLYATYISGSWGAVPAAISVDAQGDVFLAGTTYSPDYPTTPNASEPGYIVIPPHPDSFFVEPPSSSGYLTELNPAGTGLIYSSYYSGIQADTITFAAFTATGIYISGSAGADDLPGLESYPPQCGVPTYATRLSADATAVGQSRAVSGGFLGYDAATGMLLGWNGSSLTALNPQVPPSPISCILDAADLQPVSAVAPGELISIFGEHFTSSRTGPPYGAVPLGNGVGITVNGLAASLLYVSQQQINTQVPFGVAGAAQANIVFTSSTLNTGDSRTLPVVASQPAVFLDPSTAISSLCLPGSPVPLAFNADGTRNSCLQPAAAGSVLTIYLDGLGAPSPPAVTVMVQANSGVGGGPAVVDLANVSGSASGVWQAAIQISAGVTGVATLVDLKAGGVPIAPALLPIWVH